ncbi:MAG: DUF4294 domain-containing protein [Porphyromonas sp.]|nr:DUF4294 domain-containing protein [Porphyromonas sp.]
MPVKESIHKSFSTTLKLFLALLFIIAGKVDSVLAGNTEPPSSKETTADSAKSSLKGSLVPIYTMPSGERLPSYTLPNVYVFGQKSRMSERERKAFSKLVRDVKKAYPFAKMVSATLKETYEYIETLPDDGSREKHLKRMEKDLYKQFEPQMKKLTLRQGKILIKLIKRETDSTSYELVESYLGSFAASFWNLFAKMFGASLKADYQPEGEDRAIETVVLMIENGAI